LSESRDIADIRTDYTLAALDEATAGDDPILFFRKWFKEAEAAHITEVNAMTLATVDATAAPHARIVLLKAVDERGFTFFTNYDSAKGTEMSANPNVALMFFWKELERQVRIEGTIERVSSQESDTISTAARWAAGWGHGHRRRASLYPTGIYWMPITMNTK